MNQFMLLDTLKESFKPPYTTSRLLAAVAKGVMYLAQFSQMSGMEKKEQLLHALDQLVVELEPKLSLVERDLLWTAARDIAPGTIDLLVMLGKSDLWAKRKGCPCFKQSVSRR